jgi:hypothetical protein
MKTIVFFLEELSMRVFLEELILMNFDVDAQKISLQYSVYEGKQDLERNLERKLKNWQTPNTAFIVIRDQDSGDCRTIKAVLRRKCNNADKPEAIIRIVCRELESFYLGDLVAVAAGFKLSNIAKSQNKAKYRSPDYVEKPSRELALLTKKKYQKIDGARRITPNMRPDRNCSHSFHVLYRSLCEVLK